MTALLPDLKKLFILVYSLTLSCSISAQESPPPIQPVFSDEALALQLVEAAPSEASLHALADILISHALRMDATSRQLTDPTQAESMRELSLEYAWRAVKADPNHLAALRFLGSNLASHSDSFSVLAIDLLDRAQNIEYNENLDFLLASLLAENDMHDEVLNKLEPLLERQDFRAGLTEQTEKIAVAMLNNAYLLTGQLERGKDYFVKAMTTRLATPSDWRALTQLMAGLGQSSQALSLLSGAMVGLNPESSEYAQLEEIRLGLKADQLLSQWRMAQTNRASP